MTQKKQQGAIFQPTQPLNNLLFLSCWNEKHSVTLNTHECCYCVIHHTSTQPVYTHSTLHPVPQWAPFKTSSVKQQRKCPNQRDQRKSSKWKNPWTLFDWQTKKREKNKICASFYGQLANSCLCNAEWQLPQRRTGFLIRTNARRHSDLLPRCIEHWHGWSIDRDIPAM